MSSPWRVVFLSHRRGCLPFILLHWEEDGTLWQVWRTGLQVSSADWDLHQRGTGPGFLLFEGPLMAPFLPWLLEGKGHKTGVHGSTLRDFTWRQKYNKVRT